MKTESTTYNLLNSISYPEDLRKLSVEQLPELCEELRQDIIQELSCNPGHFAASLGTVELTVALHYVYNTPYDRIVWDVGHQAYGHKMLTGRREAFCTNRKFKGIRHFSHSRRKRLRHLYLWTCLQFYFGGFGYGCRSSQERRKRPPRSSRHWRRQHERRTGFRGLEQCFVHRPTTC